MEYHDVFQFAFETSTSQDLWHTPQAANELTFFLDSDIFLSVKKNKQNFSFPALLLAPVDRNTFSRPQLMLIRTFHDCNNCHYCAARVHVLCEMPHLGFRQNHLQEMLT